MADANCFHIIGIRLSPLKLVTEPVRLRERIIIASPQGRDLAQDMCTLSGCVTSDCIIHQ